jgi:hypothetical protein
MERNKSIMPTAIATATEKSNKIVFYRQLALAHCTASNCLFQNQRGCRLHCKDEVHLCLPFLLDPDETRIAKKKKHSIATDVCGDTTVPEAGIGIYSGRR